MPLLYGLGPVELALRSGKRKLNRLLIKEGGLDLRRTSAVELASNMGVEVRRVPVRELEQAAGGSQHQGVILDCGELPTLDIEQFLSEPKAGRVTLVALDLIEDPVNLGGIVRTSAFMGAAAVVTVSKRAAPLSAAASKASAGWMEAFPIIQVGNLSRALDKLKESQYWVLGAVAESYGQDYRLTEPFEKQVLVLGNEGSGLRELTRKQCDKLITIPGVGGVESLNVHVAAGVLLSRFCEPV